ncbi:MAG TPA: isocitrate/isopropylmalate family dehydrogenase [Bdellovibrionales bacterium]|nr:isocitrate/isopropylmalate family dehydrogenase [Bdellovibrionales bacterium]
MKNIVILPGDGIGPEAMKQVLRILQNVNAPFSYIEKDAGLTALEKHGSLLPDDTLQAIAEHGIALKGPITTPVGGGFKSINVTLRQKFDLYANVRPVQNLPGVATRYENVNLTIVRENTEDLYTGEERQVSPDIAESIKRITRKGSERIARYAFEYARANKRKSVAAVHKANIMKLSDGLFLRCCGEVAKEFPEIEFRDVIIDNCCMQLVMRPEQFDVIVTENLYGDILSDLCAGLVGGLGVVPGANIGKGVAIFEPVHGSAPDIAGQGKANPTALLQSAILMLRHLGEMERAERINTALCKALANKEVCTPDLGGRGSTQSFADAIISHL